MQENDLTRNGEVEMTTVQFIKKAMAQAMEEDGRVFLMGEDIAEYGGSFGVTRGLLDRFGPERIRNTPISEQGFTGIAVGAAVAGSRPVVEIMFMDFITLCVDQLVNMAAKLKYIYGLDCPLVVRTAMGAGRSYGATHSQCLERLFTGIPGLKVVAGSNGPDCASLLLGAVADPGPVIVLEHKLLYPLRWKCDESAPVSPLPPGRAKVAREGTDVTIIAWSWMTVEALRAAAAMEAEEISAEVIDLRSLAPLDMDTVLASVRKTRRVLIVEEGPLTGGLSGEIAARIGEEAFGELDAPVRRLAMPDIPVPSARELEKAMMPDAQSIAAAAVDLATLV